MQHRNFFLPHPIVFRSPSRKRISQVFITAEIMDIATTFLGLLAFPQMWEHNPLLAVLGGWLGTLAAKAAATVLVVIALERCKNLPRLAWIVPGVALAPVIWNIIGILAEVFLSA